MEDLDSIRATNTMTISYISTSSRLIQRERTNMCRAVSFNDMTAAAGTFLGVLTLALIAKVFNVVKGVLRDTLFEIQFNDRHPSSLAATVLHLQVSVPTPLTNSISSVRIMSPVVFVLTVSLLIAALALRSVSLFKRASLVPDLWVVDQKIQGMLPDTERAQQRVRSLHIAYNPLKNVAKCLCTLVMVVFAAMLPATASAAPTSTPVEKDVICIVTNMTRASDCPIGNTKYLTPEAQGLIALGVVTVVLTFILVVFGIPQWAWKWFRRLVHTSAEPVGDAETVNATAGGTIPQGHTGRLRYLRGLIPGLNLSRARRARHVPNPHTPEQRDILVAETGRSLDGEPTERPEVIDDIDLELDDLAPPAVSPPQMPQIVVGQHDLVPSVIDPEPQEHDDPKTLLDKSNTY